MLKKKFEGKISKIDEDFLNLWTFYCSTNPKVDEKTHQTRKKKLWSLIFFAINIAVISIVLALQLNSREGVTPLSNIFDSRYNTRFLLLAIICFLLTNLISSIKLNIYHRKLEKRSRPLLCLKSQMMCKYYTKITPFGIGGQPFQVYYLNRCKVKPTNSLTMVSCSYVSNKLIYGLLALIMICSFRLNGLLMEQGGGSKVIVIMAFVSFVFLAIFLTFAILLCLNKRLGNKIVGWIIGLLKKVKLIKNPYVVYLKIMRPILVFQDKMKKFFASKGAILFLILSLCEYIVEYSIPFFIYSAFNGFNIDVYWQLLSISVIIELACLIMPLPGGSGIAELSFYAIFASLFDAGILFWALIIWRILTYYSYILIGVIILIYDYVIGNRKINKL